MVLTVENSLIYPSYPSALEVGEVYVYKIRKKIIADYKLEILDKATYEELKSELT